ncbi:CDP-diacylglycerol--glycerol-3-phosphate 3-phosphatidyltransferase, mitochondrial [Neocloeon triangulifer]|uniref:CDP-diacylglycerol--glycerol-3-phosphate 3-phosphatidyltransferase, mitochondrial n=1 Tax=Neocloeon triangulifer TaxID=2078957 RepID=UPI00286F93B1|nr:CDP-diacylglycerol--glycerol-3-phosphate 3-phosphatidyltransferase, mitochondrial [Neocloeon triangulifer]
MRLCTAAACATSRGLNTWRRSLEKFEWLDKEAPRFSLSGSQVRVLRSPAEFYETLIERCQGAVHRVTLASLYLGTGPLATQLASTLDSRLTELPTLRLRVLLDFSRASRGEVNSRTLLLPLTAKGGKVALYHSPELRGIVRKLLPQRWNEVVGLQHMKIYLFDNSVIVSGANLSDDYFTNRQDRYVLINDCPALSDFLDGLASTVADFSLQLTNDNNTVLDANWKFHPFQSSKAKFVSAAGNHVSQYYQQWVNRKSETTDDTVIYPLIEMRQLGVGNDSRVTQRLIASAPAGAAITLSTGYFNLTDDYSKCVIDSGAEFDVLMAHPSANGFLGARGAAGGIPHAYTLLAHRFQRKLASLGHQMRVRLREYQRQGWTYHAKGLWYQNSLEEQPELTLVGSPNFGERSTVRDLELQLAVVTTHKGLRSQLAEEVHDLKKGTSLFPEDLNTAQRSPPLWVRLVVFLCKKFF